MIQPTLGRSFQKGTDIISPWLFETNRALPAILLRLENGCGFVVWHPPSYLMCIPHNYRDKAWDSLQVTDTLSSRVGPFARTELSNRTDFNCFKEVEDCGTYSACIRGWLPAAGQMHNESAVRAAGPFLPPLLGSPKNRPQVL